MMDELKAALEYGVVQPPTHEGLYQTRHDLELAADLLEGNEEAMEQHGHRADSDDPAYCYYCLVEHLVKQSLATLRSWEMTLLDREKEVDDD